MRSGIYKAVVLLLAVSACDPPPTSYAFYMDGGHTQTDESPSDDHGDGEEPTDKMVEEATESETATTSCLEAVLCIAANPADLFGCTADMDDETRAATTAAAVCLIDRCQETLTDTIGLALCAIANCSAESIDCVAGSLGEQAP